MATRLVDAGLQTVGERASLTTPTFGRIQAMRVDDNAAAFGQTDTTCGASTNKLAQAFDAEPTRAAQTISHVMTLAAGSFNTFTIKRVTLHNMAFGSVADASASLAAGIDGLSVRKDATFALTITVKIAYTTVVG